jgi:hypothetical protein
MPLTGLQNVLQEMAVGQRETNRPAAFRNIIMTAAINDPQEAILHAPLNLSTHREIVKAFNRFLFQVVSMGE